MRNPHIIFATKNGGSSRLPTRTTLSSRQLTPVKPIAPNKRSFSSEHPHQEDIRNFMNASKNEEAQAVNRLITGRSPLFKKPQSDPAIEKILADARKENEREQQALAEAKREKEKQENSHTSTVSIGSSSSKMTITIRAGKF